MSSLQWQNPCKTPTGKQRKLGPASEKKNPQKAKQVGYKARKPTSGEFSRTWSQIGHISAHDKMECLERCEPDRFGKEAVLQYSTNESALDSFIERATGWQPGVELEATSEHRVQ